MATAKRKPGKAVIKTTPRPAHRPSDYRPEYADLLRAYFDMPAWNHVGPDGTAREGFFPTLAGFCVQIETTQPTLWTWAHKKNEDGTPRHPEFLIAYNRAKEVQADLFTKGYMAGKYVNPAMGALIAKNLLDWKDKSEVDQTINATLDARVEVVELDFEAVRKRRQAMQGV